GHAAAARDARAPRPGERRARHVVVGAAARARRRRRLAPLDGEPRRARPGRRHAPAPAGRGPAPRAGRGRTLRAHAGDAGCGRRGGAARRRRAGADLHAESGGAMRRDGGFTLLEVMVVVFILGLLATLVAPKIMGRTDDARRIKAVADMKGIEQALNLYRLDSG